MSYELSFSHEFFMTHYDELDISPNIKTGLISIHNDYGELIEQKPKSVYQALNVMPNEQWDAACEAVGLDPKYTDYPDMLQVIKETNTCSNITTPVEVWIDTEGYHTVEVW